MNTVHELVLQQQDFLNTHRRWLHAHPDLSHQEEKSAAYIADVLRSLGLEPQEHVGRCGVTAVIEGAGEGKCAALRADFDALPVPEASGLPFASENPGVMHACGHDTHAAMLLCAAAVLCQLRNRFSGKVKLIFQPAEEDVLHSGAKELIAAGVLENPHVDAIFGQHVWPHYTVGHAAIRNGAMMAASDRFTITIRGRSSHGSAPETGVDAIVIAAQVVTALQSVVSRNVGPLESAVLTIGTIRGGHRYNVIADEVVLEGTCRTLDPAVRARMPERMESIIKGVAEGMGGSYELFYRQCYGPAINDPGQFRLVRDTIAETLGEDGLVIPEHSALTSEDFAFYCEKIPGAFFWLGVRGEDKPFYPLHSERFVPEEEALPIGAELLVNTALRFLESK